MLTLYYIVFYSHKRNITAKYLVSRIAQGQAISDVAASLPADWTPDSCLEVCPTPEELFIEL